MMPRKKISQSPSAQALKRQEIQLEKALANSEFMVYAKLFKALKNFIDNEYSDIIEDALENEWSAVFPHGIGNSETQPFLETFYDWLMQTDSLLENGYTGIELFMERTGLSAADRKILQKMNDSAASLFEIQLNGDRKSVKYLDLLLGDEYQTTGIDIPEGTETALAGGRRIMLDGQMTVGAALYPFPHEMKNDIVTIIRDEFDISRSEEEVRNMKEFLETFDPIPSIWLEYIASNEEEGAFPQMYTAIFKISDKKKVLNKLGSVPSLHKFQKNMYQWIVDSDDSEPVTRGVVLIEGDNLGLGTNTPKMLEAGKIMLLSVCSGLIRHVKDFGDDGDYLDFLDEE